MEFITLAKRRCAVRKYQKRKVEPEKLEQILEAARVAPTAGNLQPVRLLVIQSEAGLEKLRRAADVYGAPLAILVCADREKAWVRPYDQKQTGDIDASILTDHMMLQAAQLGLGSVWICYFQPEVLREAFALPDSLEPVNLLALGYPDGPLASPERHRQTRLPLTELVSYETW